MNDSMDRITEMIIQTYKEKGVLNHLEGPNLPSRKSIREIIRNYESIIFPGFESEENLDSELISYTIGAKIQQLAKDLTLEIRKSLKFGCRMKHKTEHCTVCAESAEQITLAILNKIPELREKILLDVEAALAGDPAARSSEEVILSYPGLEAIVVHRFAHELYLKEVPLIPRMMNEYIHRHTGIDIHPGATIGERFFMDHGTGIVIGETTIIGNNVSVYQGVTIGALKVVKEEAEVKRHPTIDDNVTIYSGATILGGETVIGENTTIGGNVWITSSVPANSRIYLKPPEYIIKNGLA
ncbi:serine O-acetyltransferase EpsC [Spirochaeta isovalerica]|uniref:Serine acetyltransferase n=1 Tax=Spirochaeta isovalerica TaxID=150 RepID=A0A841REV6_9SPIO|nr:serine O-acetyltransferase EpsC [Spirochaeta isovalerica]MBB6482146.1 serine O-acetyltransferase [Spirochaeta isovalerica]